MVLMEGRNIEERNIEGRNMEERNMEERNMEERNMEERNMEERNMEERNMEERNMEERNMEERNMEERNEGVFEGKLIVLEGIDGSGKTTQCHMIMDFLRKKNYGACYLKEPSDSIFGDRIRESVLRGRRYLKGEEYFFFLKDREYDVRNNIIPNLKAGKLVIMDRYYFSSMAYQGVLLEGYNFERIRRENESFAIIPDLVFIMNVSVDLALGRIYRDSKRGSKRGREDIFEKKKYLEEVRKAFQSFSSPYIIHINGQDNLEKISKNLYEILEKKILH